MVSYSSVGGLDVVLDDSGVLRLTLDRPDKRNALDDGMVAGLIAAVEAAGQDEAVRAIFVSGRGEHFCGGFDIVGRNRPGEEKPRAGSIQRRLPSQAHRLIPLLLTVQTPVVCAAR
ncbi:MAG: enoyl-CoA hydratase/isomerase family protein, partial [Acidimicrobiia bacterium]|nr:enoyl-CoA hydratase/isomerase family protein [Acidimicrobiia bacterium]